MIIWANSNSGFLLVVLIMVYTIATIIILLVTNKSNQLARQSLEQAIDLERSRVRPYLSMTVKLVSKGGKNEEPGLPYAYLFLTNHGFSQAYDVKIEITPLIYSEVSVGGNKIKKVPYFIENITSNIAPSVTLTDSIGFTANIYERYEKPIFTGTIAYSDAVGIDYVDRFSIDFIAMSNATPFYYNNEKI